MNEKFVFKVSTIYLVLDLLCGKTETSSIKAKKNWSRNQKKNK